MPRDGSGAPLSHSRVPDWPGLPIRMARGAQLRVPSHSGHTPNHTVYLFAFISLPLFHWAHRFRYTIYDLFQVKHLTGLIALLCYGAAFVGTIAAAYTLWNIA